MGISSESTRTTVTVKWISPGHEEGKPVIVEVYYSYFSPDVWYVKTLMRGETSWTLTNLPHSTKVELCIRAVSIAAEGVHTCFNQTTKGESYMYMLNKIFNYLFI